MRHLATIQTIADIQPIEGADAIEKVKVNEWWCVSKKGEFKIGDKCVYFEIDSLLPASNPAFEFLAKGTKTKTMVIDSITYTGYRLKTIRLRGQISQGLALPCHLLGLGSGRSVGSDVSETLSVVKYEAPIPAQLVGKIKGPFPSFLRKTDEERIQNMGEVVEKHRSLGTEFYIAEKLDGSSATFYKKDGVFGVCSRNLDLLETEGNTFWEMARKYRLEERLPDNLAIQGEVVGDGIQGNPLKIQGHEMYVFNVYDIETGEYYDFHNFQKVCEAAELKSVPIVGENIRLNQSVEDMLKFADGPSLINAGSKREGLVYRPMFEMREVIGGQDTRFSFKVISNDYLLSE